MTTANTLSTTESIAVNVGPPSDIEKRYAATEAQLEVWLSSMQSDDANCAYNEISSLVIRGELDVEILRQAIDKVVDRNASLRSTFSTDGQEVLIRMAVNYEFEFVDFSGLGSVDSNNSQTNIIEDQAAQPFDLVNGPLLRVVLQKISTTHHKLTFAAHHVVLDGWSLSVFCRDLGYFYDSLMGVSREPLPAANNYAEYSAKMDTYFKTEEGRLDEKFWVEQFANEIPVLDLPIVGSRPSLRTYRGSRYDHQFSTELIEKIRKVGAKSGCSLFNVMLASFKAYVARISGNDDFCVGIPTAGQAAMDCPNLIGHCVNTMPLRTKVDINTPFADFMKVSRKSLLDSFDHQCYSYGTLLRKLAPPRDPSRPPMLSISFNLDPVIDTSEMGFEGLNIDVLVEPRSFENYEWFINCVIQEDKSIEMQVQYNSDLHSNESMAFYFEGFETFLSEIAANPNAKISDFNIMSIPQRQQVIVDWNQTPIDYPLDATLSSEFARQATETPDKIAVKFEDTGQTIELTYEEVEKRSNRIARFLKSKGVQTGELVGICVDRSEQMLINLYGIMKAGAGYVPLDPAYPSDRLQYMCDHSGLKLIVTHSSLTERVSEFGKPMIAIDSEEATISSLDSNSVENAASPSDICYVIYTSGSTGKPKGVQVPHGAVVNFLYSMKETPGFDTDDSVLAVTTLSFDIAVLELYLPTIFGGTVVILDSLTAANGLKLSEQLVKHDISLLQATPATWRLMIQAGWNGHKGLKVLCGGEPMPQDLVAPLLERCSELWNMYGPTETTVWSAAFQIIDADAPILIGKPIGNTQIFILDPNGNEVPVGCEGEVFIGGAGVTLGYRNRQDLTDERFIANRYRNPFADYVSDKIYKTGDLAKYCFDGNIQFLRRNDKQVKVRGFRIELGEIEQNLKSHPAVEQNVVIVREDTPGDARLVAYLIPKTGQTVTPAELRDHLRESVPYYMVPQHFVFLETMPQTNNGKIDYKALPIPTAEVASESEEVELPNTPAEKYLASVWENNLEMDDIGRNDTFFDIGGHSLLVMKVITEVHEKTGVKLGPQEFLISTLEQMADKISALDVFGEEPSKSQEAIAQQTISEPESVVESQASIRQAALNSVEANSVEANSVEGNSVEGNSVEKKSLVKPSTVPPSAAEATSTEPSEEESPPTDAQSRKSVIRILKGFWD
ncbi:MAG: amino acid adenylation domain-containing protein [Mariniblastus sp.]